MSRGKRWVLLLAALAALCGIVVSAWKLYAYAAEADRCRRVTEALLGAAVVIADADGASGQGTASAESPAAAGGVMEAETGIASPLKVDFTALRQTNPDIAAWLYAEGTEINYPVMRSRDNQDYLRALPDGSYNAAGSLFMDCRNDPELTDRVTIIYGHNMQNDSMFGSLPDYGDQTYFDSHPVMWLSVPGADYQLELIAGTLTRADSELYRLPQTEEALRNWLTALTEGADAQSTAFLSGRDRYVLLSTCSYEFSGARYVLLGRLKRV